MLLGGGVSAAITRDPDRHPVLLAVMVALSGLTLLCWVLTLAVGEAKIDQVGVDLLVQVLLLIAVFGYYRKAVVESTRIIANTTDIE